MKKISCKNLLNHVNRSLQKMSQNFRSQKAQIFYEIRVLILCLIQVHLLTFWGRTWIIFFK